MCHIQIYNTLYFTCQHLYPAAQHDMQQHARMITWHLFSLPIMCAQQAVGVPLFEARVSLSLSSIIESEL